jgi:hypothetical protein
VSTAGVAAFARLGELELYYETQGTGPPLVIIHGLPAARLAVVPGTTHVGLCDRAEWVVPMLAEFLGDASG